MTDRDTVSQNRAPEDGRGMSYAPSGRIRQMQEAARQRYATAPGSRKGERLREAFFDLYKDAELWERQARAYAHALINEPVRINPEDRLHGMIHFKNGADDAFCGYGPFPEWGEYNAQASAMKRILRELPELAAYYDSARTFIINGGVSPGHIAWRWDFVLREGLEAVIVRHRQAAQEAADPEARHYYQGVVICLEAILEWNRRHVAAIRQVMQDPDCPPEYRASLAECATVMERVPAGPARTFHEALQAYHLLWICAFYDGPYGGNSPGRFDYLLWPFLREEYEKGLTTYAQAAELVAEAFIKCDETIHDKDGFVLTIVTGGLTPELTDAVNPLTYAVMDAIETLDLTHPAVYNRISRKNPDEYRRRCCRYMIAGGNRAQFLNEEAILRALARDGRMPPADAAMYICGGCMELNPQGLTSDLFWAFRYNICKTLELCLTGGVDLVDGSRRLPLASGLADHPDFESFYRYFEAEVEKLLLLEFKALDIAAEEMARLRPQFVISSMVEDCFRKGRNQLGGGARYADYGGALIGMPNVANSLMAIKRAVYDERFIGPVELVRALKGNFAGQEPLQQRLRRLPKYGEMNAEADALMNRLLHSVSRVFDSYTTVHGGRCKQVLLTFSFAPAFGAALGATPEGNLAGRPVAHGLTPVNTAGGLTAAMQSYLALDNELMTGGASTMWDMDSGWIDESLLASIYGAFETGGGQIFQGNMTDVRELEAALEHPERHPELIVRVGGYSARFMNLEKAVRQEIINRRRWSR